MLGHKVQAWSDSILALLLENHRKGCAESANFRDAQFPALFSLLHSPATFFFQEAHIHWSLHYTGMANFLVFLSVNHSREWFKGYQCI